MVMLEVMMMMLMMLFDPVERIQVKILIMVGTTGRTE